MTLWHCSITRSFKSMIPWLIILCCFCIMRLWILDPVTAAARRMIGRASWLEGRVISFFNPAREDEKRQSVILQMDNGVRIRIPLRCEHLGFGDSIRVHAMVSLPSGPRNPGGFDEASWTAGQGVQLVAQPTGAAPATVMKAGERWKPMRWIWAFRILFYRSFLNQIGRERADLLAAFLFGDTSGLTDAVDTDFREAGLLHILAVSGSHLSLIAAPIQLLIGPAGPGKRTRLIIQLGFLILFSATTGWQPSVVRALCMTTVAMCGKVGKRMPDGPSGLGACVTFLLLTQPWLVRNVGFVISVAAATGIIALNPRLLHASKAMKAPRAIRLDTCVAMAAQAGTLPVLLSRVRQLPLLSMPAGIVIMPLVGILLPFGLLLGVAGLVGGSGVLAYIVNTLLHWIVAIAAWVAGQRGSQLAIPFWTPFAGVAIGCALAAVTFRIRKLRHRMALASAAACLVFFIQWGVDWALRPDLTVVFADVGQGDCTVLLTRDGTSVVIDCGTESAGSGIVLPMLAQLGIDRPDLCIATHGHADHAGGFLQVIARKKPGLLYLPPAGTAAGPETGEADMTDRLLSFAASAEMDVVQLRAGSRIQISKSVCIEVLNPSTDSGIGNENSLVLLVTYGSFSILISGDAGKLSEESMMDRGQLRDIDILRVAHHGSDGATGEEMLRLIKPEVAVISVGRNNYGHPSAGALDRLRSAGSSILRTDRNGAVILRLTREKMQIKKFAGGSVD
ncbi:MAG TPA: DNA internalization-related competence protein ComEC/Rec2 [Clostridia bacterium]